MNEIAIKVRPGNTLEIKQGENTAEAVRQAGRAKGFADDALATRNSFPNYFQGGKGDTGAGGNVAVGRAQLKTGPAADATVGDVYFLSEEGRDGDFKVKAGAPAIPDPCEATSVVVSPTKHYARVRDRFYNGQWFGMKADGTESSSGTDNTAVFQDALDKLRADGGGDLYLPAGPGFYDISGPLKNPTGASSPSQVFLPATNLPGGDLREFAITISGDTPPGSYIQDPRGATILRSTLATPGGSCIGSLSVSSHENGAIAQYQFKNLCFYATDDPQNMMLDTWFIPMLDMQYVVFAQNGIRQRGGYIKPTKDIPAFRGAKNDTPLWHNLRDVVVYGFGVGLQPGELSHLTDVNVSNCIWAMDVVESRHPLILDRMVLTSIGNGIRAKGKCNVRGSWTTEHASRPGWANPGLFGWDVYDPSGFLYSTPDDPVVIHCHDGERSGEPSVNAPNLHWAWPRPLSPRPYGMAFPALPDVTDAKSLREITATGGKTAWHSDLTYMPTVTQGQSLSARSAANTARSGPDYLVGVDDYYADGNINRAGWRIALARDGLVRTVFDINSFGQPIFPQGLFKAASEAAAKAAGVPVGGLFKNTTTGSVGIVE